MDSELEIHALKGRVESLEHGHRYIITKIVDMGVGTLMRLREAEERLKTLESEGGRWDAGDSKHDMHRFDEVKQ